MPYSPCGRSAQGQALRPRVHHRHGADAPSRAWDPPADAHVRPGRARGVQASAGGMECLAYRRPPKPQEPPTPPASAPPRPSSSPARLSGWVRLCIAALQNNLHRPSMVMGMLLSVVWSRRGDAARTPWAVKDGRSRGPIIRCITAERRTPAGHESQWCCGGE